MLNGLDLFSGIGGISIALNPWVRTVAYCEQDRYAQGVLLSRMLDHGLERAPIWDDIRTLKGSMLPEIDIIFGGFPCQDLSVAGAGKGLAGERSGLFFEIIRLVKETSPSFVFLENVPAIRTRGLSAVINAFTEVGYDCRWTCLSASSVGANHKRERWFLLAHANGGRRQQRDKRIRKIPVVNSSGPAVANAGCARWKELNSSSIAEGSGHNPWSSSEIWGESWWEVEPSVGRVVDGIPDRVGRIKCLGNSVVPLQVRTAFTRLIGME